MKKNFLLLMVFSLCIFTVSFAQTSASVETPRNYKPKAKELMPMPGELTDETIFPVLGMYEYVDGSGNSANVTVSRDADNKGIVWINGMPQGKFKADLKASPSVYKIPAQKTLQNDVEGDMSTTADSASAGMQSGSRFSGKALQEGTLILDSASNKLYINIGGKFNEDNPAAVFPELNSVTAEEPAADTVADTKKKTKKKAPVVKSTTYVLTKTITDPAAATTGTGN